MKFWENMWKWNENNFIFVVGWVKWNEIFISFKFDKYSYVYCVYI